MRNHLAISAICFMMATSCSNTSTEIILPIPNEKEELSINVTRAEQSDNGYFEEGDQVGIYVVNHTSAGAGSLISSGNYVDNMCFTYSNGWLPVSPIYWADSKTKADFYCYSPYTSNIENVKEYIFSINADQSKFDAYKASDFLWGKSVNKTSSSNPVNIQVSHLMSRLVVKLVAGNGYSDNDLSDAEVIICSMQNEAVINLSNGATTPSGFVEEVVPYVDNDDYCALLVPQTISNSDFVKVTIGGLPYVLKQSLTLESGKQHQCTITLSKTNQGINIGITDWEVDPIDYGGVLE